jgi:hypothetical protein
MNNMYSLSQRGGKATILRPIHLIGPNRLLLCTCSVLLVLLWLPVFMAVSLASVDDVSPSDDAFHYPDWADGRNDGNYTEWWYFNLFDSEQNLQSIFTYLITDPDNITRRGFAQVTAVAYTPLGIVSKNDVYAPGLFSASSELADVEIGDNSILAINDDLYEIRGLTRDGRLSWNLRYTRKAEPWFAADRINVGSLPWEQMDWLVHMPRAEVTGNVTVDGKVYSVAGVAGYHDHNWGEWFPPDALWNWAQYSEPGLAFEVGDFTGKPAGVVSIEFQGERTAFTKDQYRLSHRRWAFDSINRVWYPTRSLLHAQNESTRLAVTLQAIMTDPLRGDLPFPLPDVLIYEQTARYEGRLWKRNAQGRWVLLARFQGNGFKEYTAVHRDAFR